MRTRIPALAATLALSCLPVAARADDPPTAASSTQAPAPPTTSFDRLARVFVAASGGYQSNEFTFTDGRSEPLYGETRSWTADYAVKSGPVYDVGVGVRLWRGLAAGVAYSWFTDRRAAGITGTVPHPFFFDQPRAIAGESPKLRHEEQAIHVSALWTVPAGRHVDVTVFGGPSIFRLSRDLVEDVGYTEQGYPYDTVGFGSTTVTRVKRTDTGFHVGADVTWMFTRVLGVGGFARFARAQSKPTSPASGDPLAFDLGGLQAGGGLRLQFGRSARSAARGPALAPAPAPGPASVPPPPAGAVSRDRTKPSSEPVTPSAGIEMKSTVRLKVAAPVFIVPDATRKPLRELKAGTRLKVREDAGDWLVVEFGDPQYGPRVGYVLKANTDW